MTNGSLITTKGKNTILNRSYTENASLSSTEYLAPSKFKVGTLNTTPSVIDLDLDYPIPITNGTVNDNGNNTLTGSDGGTDSTDNPTTFKEGAGTTDVTAQNLLTTGTNTTKTWSISNLATLGTIIDSAKYGGLWIYIKDSAALDKIVSLEFKLGSDTTNYYSITFLNVGLTTGWNWMTSSSIISGWTETGTVTGDIDIFVIEAITNADSDAFVSGDLVYDLLRTWAYTDTISDFVTDYPSFDYTNNEVTIRTYLNSVQANGFNINALALVNEDTTPLMCSEDVITAESKSSTDEFAFVVKDRIL